ncbi:AlpA family phage regulatory protein [Pandoraea sp. XJJ-1]|uniref:helix-turn-helix transcriptional regulator n=1 Tax=Pandoraea sp. XJJ-1 TaxID=3002643 RepID=UPI00227E31C5|nr:AlpA family phage regulatory protein [Pandoraea sp. XJJ-1]WAL83744.1 AlpA family phage regulatory protein [Pandoraea sp. XJJ-1]
MEPSNYTVTRAIGLREVALRVGRSRASIYEALNKKSPRYDAAFPVPFKLGRRTLFVEAEIEQWLQAKIAANRTC